MTSEGRRLHPAAVGASAVDALRGLAVPVLVLVVAGGNGDLGRILLYGLLGLAVSVGSALLSWVQTRWSVDDDTVRLRRRLLGESVTSIPLERVQAIDTVRGPVQRLFGAVELHVQAAGGGKAGEIVLRAVSPAEAEELREAVREASGEARPAGGAFDPAAPEAVASAGPSATWSLGGRPLVLAALTSGSLGVLVPVVAFASQVLDDLVAPREAERLIPHTAGGLALLGVGVLVFAWVLSVVGTLVAFAGFGVTREGARLRIRRGFVERREASVPVARVHAVRVIESPLREPFGLATVRVETAGYAAEPATAQTLLPLVRKRDLPDVLGRLLPELGVPAAALADLAPQPRRALRRQLVVPVAVALAVLVVACLVFGAIGALALVLVVGEAVSAVARHRAAGWRLDDGRLVLRSRRIARTTAVVDARRLQAVVASATPLQRRVRLASLRVDVSSGRGLAVEDFDQATVGDLQARLAGAMV